METEEVFVEARGLEAAMIGRELEGAVAFCAFPFDGEMSSDAFRLAFRGAAC